MKAPKTLTLIFLLTALLGHNPATAAVVERDLYLKDTVQSIGTIRLLSESGSCDSLASCLAPVDGNSAIYFFPTDLLNPGEITSVYPTRAAWELQSDGNLLLSLEGFLEPFFPFTSVIYTPGAIPGQGTVEYYDSITAGLIASADVILVPPEQTPAVPAAPIPIPAALPMFLAALAGLGLMARSGLSWTRGRHVRPAV